MLRWMTVWGIPAVFSAAVPLAADAQDAQIRQGFFVGGGIGGGSFGCANCDGREGGLAGLFRTGLTLTPQLLLAGELSSLWMNPESGARRTHTTLTAAAQFYPVIDRGLFVSAGVGASMHELSSSDVGFSFSASDKGFGATAGLGYDIRVGSSVLVSPYALFVWGSFDGGGANHFQGGLGAAWH